MNRGQDVITESEKVKKLETRLSEQTACDRKERK
jgi:hypothetical protein